eukprot:9808855-Alexandrium_andersonii.AAC.1
MTANSQAIRGGSRVAPIVLAHTKTAASARSLDCAAPETTPYSPLNCAAHGNCTYSVSYTHLTLPTIC